MEINDRFSCSSLIPSAEECLWLKATILVCTDQDHFHHPRSFYQRVNCSYNFFFNIFWRIVGLQCCVRFKCTAKWIHYTWTHVCSFYCCSVTLLCPTLCNLMDCSTPGLPVPHNLPEFAQVHVHCTGDAVQPFHRLTRSSPSALSLFQHRDFSNESSVPIRWPKYWSFSFSISPSSEYSASISLKIDWFDLAVQETLRSLLQHHSSKASVLRRSALFTVQLSQPYVSTGKTTALTMWTFVGRIMSAFQHTV